MWKLSPTRLYGEATKTWSKVSHHFTRKVSFETLSLRKDNSENSLRIQKAQRVIITIDDCNIQELGTHQALFCSIYYRVIDSWNMLEDTIAAKAPGIWTFPSTESVLIGICLKTPIAAKVRELTIPLNRMSSHELDFIEVKTLSADIALMWKSNSIRFTVGVGDLEDAQPMAVEVDAWTKTQCQIEFGTLTPRKSNSGNTNGQLHR